MKTIIASILLVAIVMCTGCKSKDRQQNLNDAITVLNEQGVVWQGSVTGPLDAGFEMYSGGRVTTGGWFNFQIQSPVMNPGAASKDDAEAPKADPERDPSLDGNG